MSHPGIDEEEYYRLRAEWLRYRNHVFDVNADLPTLAAVLDEVRRLSEERGPVGLIYLDLGGSPLEIVQGWYAHDDVLRQAARVLLDLRSQGVLGPRDVVATLSVRSDKFLLFVAGKSQSDTTREAMADLTDRVLARLRDGMASFLPGSIGADLLHAGYSVLYRDPMLRAERAIHRALDEALLESVRQKERDEDRRARSLDALIAGQQVVTLFQPILDLHDLSVLGHEAFSRGPVGSPLEDAEGLFLTAERAGRLWEIERMCRTQALFTARRFLDRGRKLFLNTSVAALRDPEVAGSGFTDEVQRQGFDRSDVVLEITERATGASLGACQDVLRRLKGEGFGIAIDDMGAGYASLQTVVEIEPDYLKFDVSLVHNIDRSRIKRSLLETLVELAERIGSTIIAEGIEAESEYRTVRDMGVRLGQGRYLAPPVVVPGEAA